MDKTPPDPSKPILIKPTGHKNGLSTHVHQVQHVLIYDEFLRLLPFCGAEMIPPQFHASSHEVATPKEVLPCEDWRRAECRGS